MKHVLIVDDDRTTARLLAMMLEMDGFKVSQFPQPEQALENGRRDGVDAFVIDCNLAGRDGLELLRNIRADETLARTPVIVTSGRDLAVEAMAAGASVFLLKPFSPSMLTAKLAELLP